MPSKKVVREPNTYSVELTIDAQPTRDLCALLVSELVKYLQYSRGQVQTPCDQLLAQAQAWMQAQQQAPAAGGKTKRRPPAGVRKALKYTQSLQALLSAIEQLPFEDLAGAPVCIMFGPTPRRPAEVYRLFLPPCAAAPRVNGQAQPQGASPDTASSSKSSAHGAIRRMLRAMVMQHGAITEWDGQPGATKMFMLLQAPPAVQPPSSSFLPKRSFALALKRKAFQVDICTGTKGSSTTAATIHPLQRLDRDSPASPEGLQQQMQEGMHITDDHDADEGLLWHQCSVVLKGIRPSNSNT